jgi:xanthine dehydrogenase small subunit
MPGEKQTDSSNNSVRFLLDDEIVEVRDVHPTRSVLQFLREDLGRTGTKEGCAEGDCGACTVVLGELNGDRLETRTVNACIQFVPSLDGKALFTVEDLRQPDAALHPVQQAMVDCHGSQCGFCTPGFVMSLWNEYIEHQAHGTRPGRDELRNALTGNLCRCTGYRPIIEAGEQMFDLPNVAFDRARVGAKLEALRRAESLRYEAEGVRFFAPRTLEELVQLRGAHPSATILAGCTDIGLWVSKQFRDLGDIIYIGEVGDLKKLETNNGVLRIGAALPLTDAYRALVEHYPEVTEMWERFASVPIRNAGTLGGNVANGSPIGDSMPWLITVGARVVLRNRERARTLELEDLYLDYMRKSMLEDEIVEAIEVPLPQRGQRFRTYKVCKRYDSDISAVCAAFSIGLEGERITDCRVAFGGMAATPKRAAGCEAALAGQIWNEATAAAGMEALAEDFSPLTDMRASDRYRMRTAQNLLSRFYLETRPQNPLPSESVSVFAFQG